MNTLQRIFKNTFSLFFSGIIGQFFAFCTFVYFHNCFSCLYLSLMLIVCFSKSLICLANRTTFCFVGLPLNLHSKSSLDIFKSTSLFIILPFNTPYIPLFFCAITFSSFNMFVCNITSLNSFFVFIDSLSITCCR